MLFMADVFTFIVSQAIKLSTRRKRPEGEWGQSYRKIDPHSFPSGHASRGGTLAAMGLAVGPVWFGVAMAIWGVSVALSRVATGVHYVSDSVAGFVLGVCVTALIMLLVF
jgi:undecaprenyl-diphosphatase